MAFNAKNLSYNKQEPAFLRKLKGEFGGLDGRHNVQIARPKKDRLKTGDDDDDPVILDEQGERVEKEEFERRMREGDEVKESTPTETGEAKVEGESGTDAERERQKVTEIGSSTALKKRKVGKVVGAEDEGEPDLDGNETHEPPKKAQTAQKKVEDGESTNTKKPGSGAAKKKAKKIKLSFDDPDG
ncbi:hypothetical protein ABEF93_001884 [Exophiala dermatitidis]